MTTPETEEGRTQLWRITIPVYASAGEVEALTGRLVETLCPDTAHEGPCPTPWALHVADAGSLSKAEQRRLREAIADPND